ncbi:MAG TPA: hypothetical protein VK862_03090 [Afifellaceae bacterium]|nr:hypothetical protein [Afifellaceae bacterium]
MRKRDLIALSAIAYFTFSGSAFAYLDPGTGSIILQGIIGAVAGGLFFARTYIDRVKAYFGRHKGAGDVVVDDSQDEAKQSKA